MSRSSTLYRLQRVDSQLDALQAQLAVLNARLASSPAVQKAQADLAAAQARAAEARSKAKTLEQDSQGLAEKIREVEEQLYGGKVTNPRELIDFQAEAESLQRNRSGVDDKQLAAIEAAEAAEKMEAAAGERLSAAEAARVEEVAGIARDKEPIEAAIAKLGEEREAVVVNVPVEDLSTYDALRNRKRGVAVALLEDGICAACGVAPSSSRIQAARQGGGLVHCSNCERIIYAESGKGYGDTGDREDEMIHRW